MIYWRKSLFAATAFVSYFFSDRVKNLVVERGVARVPQV